jgi:hypothetical protein
VLYLSHHNKNLHKGAYSRIASITQDMRYRLSLIHYANKYGVSKAAVRYKTNRQYIYRWKRRFVGSLESLRDRSRKPQNPKCIPKPYEAMSYPRLRIQVDVKFVPSVCLVGDAKRKRFYQYTAINEFSRWRFVEAFEEHSSYSSAQFLEHLVKAFPLPFECVQTDNGQVGIRSRVNNETEQILSAGTNHNNTQRRNHYDPSWN